ncbi:MAG: hypothetical protein M3N52_01170, partial [Actinomycetota bacterium]|nr:hypothetical protein [Actinomycetota bacterium]
MMPPPVDHWLFVAAPFLFYGLVVYLLALFGEHGEERNLIAIFFRRISWSLERLTGYPGWAMAGALSALLMLGVAVTGLYWDVAFHIDRGRDEVLFTPSHTMIVLGLGGLVYSAVIAVIFATLERAPVGLRFLGLQLPWSALTLAALGAGGVAGFPLDDLWHEAYGIDVTLWSPTHLQLVGGGALATLPVWLMLLEARPRGRPTLLGRGIHVLALGAVLTGLSAFQGEFEFGVPQFQVAYLPILVAAAAAFTLVLARVDLGPGGALKAVVAFLVVRGCIGLIVAGAFHHTLPRFPLYLVAAVCVEAAARALGTARRLRFALVAGTLVGTIGVAAEMVWVRASGWFPDSPPALSKAVLLAPVAAVAAAILGAALTRAVGDRVRLSWPAVALALVFLAAALAYPLPRNVGPVEAIVRLQPAGSSATVDVALLPPDAARRATAFAVVSWQGGGRVQAALLEVAPGRYVSSRPVPISGSWKSMVSLQRDDEVMAAPIYLPADPAIGASAVPALPERQVRFVRNTEVLLREAHGG